MQEISMSEFDQVNGGIWQFIAGYLGGKAIDYAIDAVASGGVDYSSYVNDNQYYWVGA